MSKQKRYLNVLFLLCISPIPLPITANAATTDDDAEKIRILYQSRQQVSKDGVPCFITDTMALEVGQNHSVYYDFNQAKRDSIASSLTDVSRLQTVNLVNDIEYLEKMLESREKPDIILSDRDSESSRIFKDRSLQEIITADRDHHSYKFVVKETLSFDWEVSADTLTVLNYVCMKATTRFRGRTYTAWFATDIPVNDGPWKFYGLPGLILKIEDSEHVFNFEAIGLKKIADFTVGQNLAPASQRINLTYDQLNDYRRRRHKKLSYGFYQSSSSITFFSGIDNPVTYPDMEIK
ncbi:MAG: GLPGLI family protein [Dysgonamonadaceae bacterium]|jgi:GLPGLI family protein|nr:GLPGLI family protein [Dysgonamonadaceae bacterium]